MSNYFSYLNNLATGGLACASHSITPESSLAISDSTTGDLTQDGPCSRQPQSKRLHQLTFFFWPAVAANHSSSSAGGC